MSTDGRGYLAVTIAAMLWGIAGATAKHLFASREGPPFLLVHVRMGLSFAILALVLGAVAPRLLRLQHSAGGSLLLIFGATARLLVSPLGLASGLASAGFMSFYTIYGSKRIGRLSPWSLLCYGLGFGFAFWLLVDAGLAVAGRPVPGLHLLSSGAMWAFFAARRGADCRRSDPASGRAKPPPSLRLAGARFYAMGIDPDVT